MDIAYNCLLCGNCDVACKVCRYNMEPLQAMQELRFKLVEDGKVLPRHTAVIEGLRKGNNMMRQPAAGRGGLEIFKKVAAGDRIVLSRR